MFSSVWVMILNIFVSFSELQWNKANEVFFFPPGSTVSHHNLAPIAITFSSLPWANLCRLTACLTWFFVWETLLILFSIFRDPLSSSFALWDMSALMLGLRPDCPLGQPPSPGVQVAVMKNGNYRRKNNSLSLAVCRLQAAMQTDFEPINPQWIHHSAKAHSTSLRHPLIKIIRDDSHNYLLCLTETSNMQQCWVVLTMGASSQTSEWSVE